MSVTRTATPTPVAESDVDDLATQRYFFDLLLQPLDEWEGFQRIEHFGLSAFRYELNFSQWALAMSQFTRTPAFTGYLVEAQRNAHRERSGRWAAYDQIPRLPERPRAEINSQRIARLCRRSLFTSTGTW